MTSPNTKATFNTGKQQELELSAEGATSTETTTPPSLTSRQPTPTVLNKALNQSDTLPPPLQRRPRARQRYPQNTPPNKKSFGQKIANVTSLFLMTAKHYCVPSKEKRKKILSAYVACAYGVGGLSCLFGAAYGVQNYSSTNPPGHASSVIYQAASQNWKTVNKVSDSIANAVPTREGSSMAATALWLPTAGLNLAAGIGAVIGSSVSYGLCDGGRVLFTSKPTPAPR